MVLCGKLKASDVNKNCRHVFEMPSVSFSEVNLAHSSLQNQWRDLEYFRWGHAELSPLDSGQDFDHCYVLFSFIIIHQRTWTCVWDPCPAVDGSTFFFRTCRWEAEFWVPFTPVSLPGPKAAKRPQTMTLPPLPSPLFDVLFLKCCPTFTVDVVDNQRVAQYEEKLWY